MLGRTAASLFWMSRYVERAENISRLVEVGYRSMLVTGSGSASGDWRSTLSSAASLESYEDLYPEVTRDAVIDFLLFDTRNPTSVRNCIETARNNARGVRIALTREMWEALNTTWVEYSAIQPKTIGVDKLPEFLEWIRGRAIQFRGAMLGTLLRTPGYHFSQLGAFIERADSTARILDAKYYMLLPRAEMVGGETDTFQWETILRSVSAHRSYRHVFHDRYRPLNIAEFLILKPQMPRSLRFCYDWVNDSITGLEEAYDNRPPSHDLAVSTLKNLQARDMNSVFHVGLHEFLNEFMIENARLADAISEDYYFG